MIEKLKIRYTVVAVIHGMRKAARVSGHTAFMMLGELNEFDKTDTVFTNPTSRLIEDTITAGFGWMRPERRAEEDSWSRKSARSTKNSRA